MDITKMNYAELSEALSGLNKSINEIGDVSKGFHNLGLRFKLAALKVMRRDVINEINLEADSITSEQIYSALGGLIVIKN